MSDPAKQLKAAALLMREWMPDGHPSIDRVLDGAAEIDSLRAQLAKLVEVARAVLNTDWPGGPTHVRFKDKLRAVLDEIEKEPT